MQVYILKISIIEYVFKSPKHTEDVMNGTNIKILLIKYNFEIC